MYVVSVSVPSCAVVVMVVVVVVAAVVGLQSKSRVGLNYREV